MDSHTDNASYPAHVPRVLSNPNTHTHRHCEIPYGRNVQELPNQYSGVFEKFDTIGDHIAGRKANQLFFLNTFESKQVPKS